MRAPCWKQSTGYIPEDLQARHVKYVLNQKDFDCIFLYVFFSSPRLQLRMSWISMITWFLSIDQNNVSRFGCEATFNEGPTSHRFHRRIYFSPVSTKDLLLTGFNEGPTSHRFQRRTYFSPVSTKGLLLTGSNEGYTSHRFQRSIYFSPVFLSFVYLFILNFSVNHNNAISFL